VLEARQDAEDMSPDDPNLVDLGDALAQLAVRRAGLAVGVIGRPGLIAE
jgi:hypothetical protein